MLQERLQELPLQDPNTAKQQSSTKICVKHPSQDLYIDGSDLYSLIHEKCGDIEFIDTKKLSLKIFSSLPGKGVEYDDLEDLIIRTAAMSMDDQPEYSKVAARFLSEKIIREMRQLNIHSFSDSIKYGFSVELIGKTTFDFVMKHQKVLNDAIQKSRSGLYEYFGLKTVYDRYLLKDPKSRHSTESEQFFLMRVACGLSTTPEAVSYTHLTLPTIYSV